MERYSEAIGLPVICIENGKRLGIVKDVVFCPKTREVKGFLLESKGYEIRKKIVLMSDVLNMGRDAVVVGEADCIKNMKKLEGTGVLKDKGEIRGLKVYTRTGRDLGIVKDVLFDHKTGLVEGIEVSDGLLQDIVLGRNILPLFGKVEFGEENIIVDREAAEEMTGTGGGLKNYLEK
ncbi:MAG: PRC-barrel domain-containing protein [Clostridia bacterium]|nr:PRC-barrel domain-containing protein [Clostridia bacterium]